MIKKVFLPILLITATVLLVPAMAMKFTQEVNWGIGDFAIAAVLLMSTGLAIQLLRQRISNPKVRTGLILLVFAILVLLWAELAVGIFGSAIAGD